MLISKKISAKFRSNFTKFGNFGGGRNFGDTEIKNLDEMAGVTWCASAGVVFGFTWRARYEAGVGSERRSRQSCVRVRGGPMCMRGQKSGVG